MPNDPPKLLPPKPQVKREVNLTRTERTMLIYYAQSEFQNVAYRKTLEELGRPIPKNENAINSAASKLLRKIREKMTDEEFWEALGLSKARIARALREGMDATYVKHTVLRKQEVVTYMKADGSPGSRVMSCDELIEKEYPDHIARERCARTAALLTGEMTTTGNQDAGNQGTGKLTFIFNIGAPKKPEPIDVTP